MKSEIAIEDNAHSKVMILLSATNFFLIISYKNIHISQLRIKVKQSIIEYLRS
jgi:hypothetical protein